MQRRFAPLALVALFLTWSPAALAEAGDPVAQAQRLATDFAAPRYQRLAESAAAQADLWTRSCAAPGPQTEAALQAAFVQTLDDWQDIALFRFGPISEANRAERIAFWPDKRNLTDKRLREWLVSTDPIPDAAAMADRSAAIQGFPALERVLFGEQRDAFDSPKGARRCAIGTAIAGNIAAIARDVSAIWSDEKSPVRAGLTTTDGALEALRRATTDLVAGYEFILDDKVSVPMGPAADKAKPLVAEFRRSNQSLPSIRRNLAALRDLSDVLLKHAPDEITADTAAEAIKVAISVPDDALQQPEDAAKRAKMQLLKAAIMSARDVARETIPAALGVTIGFNSADGD
jgi:predicted lipoprotein